MTSPKEKSLQQLINEADAAFSEYIRLFYSDSSGMVSCSCGCGQRKPWRQMQASHYMNRDNMATRFSTWNVVPATRECNYYDKDHKDKIGAFINYKFKHTFEEADMSVTEWLDKKGHSNMKFTRPEIVEIRDSYKLKFNELKKSKGL